MNYIYFVSPVASDPNYGQKRTVLHLLEVELNLKFVFPLEHHESFVLQSVIEDLARASLVIADLSLERPSCYFELGVAQACGVKIILIAASGTRIHQTGSVSHVQMYTDLGTYHEVVRMAVSQIGQKSDV